MTEAQIEFLKYLYFLANTLIFLVKVAFYLLIFFMLLEFIMELYKDMRDKIRKR